MKHSESIVQEWSSNILLFTSVEQRHTLLTFGATISGGKLRPFSADPREDFIATMRPARRSLAYPSLRLSQECLTKQFLPSTYRYCLEKKKGETLNSWCLYVGDGEA